MGNIAELILRNHGSGNVNPDDLAQAESWARKGLELTISARKVSAIKHDVCEEAFAMLLYNLAIVREVCSLHVLRELSIHLFVAIR